VPGSAQEPCPRRRDSAKDVNAVFTGAADGAVARFGHGSGIRPDFLQRKLAGRSEQTATERNIGCLRLLWKARQRGD